MKTRLLHALRYAVIVSAVAAATYTLMVGRAAQLFQRDTAVSVAAAVDLQPHNAAYLDRLASWQPGERTALLQRSVAENPFNENALIRLGFLAEMQEGDNAAAERYYRRAAEVNHMFLPRWTLTNFYFRQQRSEEFFHWTRETLIVTPYASDPVFAQMRLMTQDENTLHNAIPDRPRILLQYAWYLANHKEFDGVPRAVERLVQLVGKDDPNKWGRNDLLAATEDHMLAAGYLKPAIKVWSTLQDAGWLDEPAPNQKHPLSGGDFPAKSYRHGFDWVSVDTAGARVEHFPDSPGVRISLYGDQAERMTLMQEYVPAAAGRRYEMKWQAQGDELSEPSGLAWHLHPVNGAGAAQIDSGDLMSSNAKWDFVVPGQAAVYLLTLEYIRPLGTTRARGAVTLKSVKMDQR